jgi:CHAT domain-containing protein/tetratricopeptide (TPR) repeat protein
MLCNQPVDICSFRRARHWRLQSRLLQPMRAPHNHSHRPLPGIAGFPRRTFARCARVAVLIAGSAVLTSCLNILATPGYVMPQKMEQSCATGSRCVWLVSVYEAMKDYSDTRRFLQDHKYNEAKRAALKTVDLYERTVGTNYPYLAITYTQLGFITRQQGRLAEAEIYYERALKIMKHTLGADHIEVAGIENWLGDAYSEDRRYAEAEALHLDALRIHERYVSSFRDLYQMWVDSLAHLYFNGSAYTHATGVAEDVKRLAILYHREGRDSEAEPLYGRAIEAHEKVVNGWLIKYTPRFLGHKLLPLPNLRTAETSYMTTLQDLGTLYLNEKRYPEAEQTYLKSLRLGEKAFGAGSPETAGSLVLLGDVYAAENRWPEAEASYRRERKIVKDDVWNKYALALYRDGKLAEARPVYEWGRKAMLSIGRINAEQPDQLFRKELHEENQTLQQYAALLSDVARSQTGDQTAKPPDLDAFVVLEQARNGRAQGALEEAEARNLAGDTATSELAREVQQLRNRHASLENQLMDEYAKPASQRNQIVMASLPDAMLAMDRQTDLATSNLLQNFPRYSELTAPNPIDYTGVQNALRNDEALVSYYALDDRLLMWLIRPGQAPLYREHVIKKSDLSAAIARLRASIDPKKPFDVEDAHQLYVLLLHPFEKDLASVRQLIIVPDETLLPLPFATLVTSTDADAYATLAAEYHQGFAPSPEELEHDYPRIEWLAKASFAWSMLPSATSLRVLRDEPRRNSSVMMAGSEPFIGIGDPLLEGRGTVRGGSMLATRGAEAIESIRQLPRLRGTRDELLAEANALGASPDHALFTGERATKPIVMSLNDKRLGEAKIIAFATHALIGGELEGLKEPALVLTPPPTLTEGDDGLLSIDDILKLKLTGTDWVILSACNTAASDGSGEGLSGLARAFFYAGTPSLLISQWSVDDTATQDLMAGVLSEYAANPKVTRARALQLGMLQLMQQQARGDHAYFAHPFSWAPFFIVGEGARTIHAGSSRTNLNLAEPSKVFTANDDR